MLGGRHRLSFYSGRRYQRLSFFGQLIMPDVERQAHKPHYHRRALAGYCYDECIQEWAPRVSIGSTEIASRRPLIALANGLDLVSTYLASPDLSDEWNLLQQALAWLARLSVPRLVVESWPC